MSGIHFFQSVVNSYNPPAAAPAGVTPLLDLYGTDIVSGYSVRKLDSTYSGDCLQVRRTSDNATQDIGFDADGYIDVAALESFCAGTDGRVTLWYDQSGNGYHLGTAGYDLPLIVDNGTAVTNPDNGKVAVYSDTIAVELTTTSLISQFSTSGLFSVVDLVRLQNRTGDSTAQFWNLDNDNARMYQHRLDNSQTELQGILFSATSGIISVSDSYPYLQQTVTHFIGRGTSTMDAYLDGAQTWPTQNADLPALQSTKLELFGRREPENNTNEPATIYRHEFVIWNSDLRGEDQTGIEANVAAAFPTQPYVTSQLVTYLDANTTTGGSSTITSTNGAVAATGTIVNGTYSSDNEGYWEFSAGDNGINLDDQNVYGYGDGPTVNTTEAWVYFTSTDVALFAQTEDSRDMFLGVRNGAVEIQGYYTQFESETTTNFNEGWNQIVGVHDLTTGALKLYTNGVLRSSGTYSVVAAGGVLDDTRVGYNCQNGVISGTWNLAGSFRFSILRVYDKALSDAEVLQNFNANRERFGLPEPVAPSYVTDELVVRLDAGDSNSYPGSGTTWTDLSDNAYATVINGGTYDSADGGTILLDGSDYIDLTTEPSFPIEKDFTFSAMVNISAFNGANPGFWRTDSVPTGPGGGDQFNIFQSTTGRPWIRWASSQDILKPASGYAVPLNEWVYVTYVVEQGTSAKFYANGVLQHSNTHGISASPSFRYVGFQDQTTEKPVAKYGTIEFYSKALSEPEINQNFDVIKSRYGL